MSDSFVIYNKSLQSAVVVLCEHASNTIPLKYNGLGLTHDHLQEHYAWDIGAKETALLLAERLNCPLVYANYSRLLLDLNRPVQAHDSIVTEGEGIDIPGNLSLDDLELQRRHAIYAPFHEAVENLITSHREAGLRPTIISIHSFTPVYHGKKRPWHIGVLSQHDRRLADTLLNIFRADLNLCVGDNQPYAPADGVYHSMEKHGEANGLPCVMLEIRNDLIADSQSQIDWAERIAQAIESSLATINSLATNQPPTSLFAP